MTGPVVLDASVGVKWTKSEAGSDEALALLTRHYAGDIVIVVPEIFVQEVLDVVRRRAGPERAREQWRDWRATGIVVPALDDELMNTALDLCGDLGCTLYDAMAPALAARIGAPLYSADRRAHGSIQGVTILD